MLSQRLTSEQKKYCEVRGCFSRHVELILRISIEAPKLGPSKGWTAEIRASGCNLPKRLKKQIWFGLLFY